MTSWENHSMWLIILDESLGDLAKMPVAVYDDEKDANNHIKQLEQRQHESFGNYPNRIWRIVPIKVNLNQENFPSKDDGNIKKELHDWVKNSINACLLSADSDDSYKELEALAQFEILYQLMRTFGLELIMVNDKKFKKLHNDIRLMRHTFKVSKNWILFLLPY